MKQMSPNTTPVTESTCVYLIHDHQWLMLYRNKKENDVNAGKYIGVGGKAEPGEKPLQCAMREVREETGLIMHHPVCHGTVTFRYPDRTDEKIWIYTCIDFSGIMHEDNEGTLLWVPETEILNLNVWDGDRIFLKKLLNHEDEKFNIRLSYDENDILLSAEEREDGTE